MAQILYNWRPEDLRTSKLSRYDVPAPTPEPFTFGSFVFTPEERFDEAGLPDGCEYTCDLAGTSAVIRSFGVVERFELYFVQDDIEVGVAWDVDVVENQEFNYLPAVSSFGECEYDLLYVSGDSCYPVAQFESAQAAAQYALLFLDRAKAEIARVRESR